MKSILHWSALDADAHKGHGLDIGYQKAADEQSWAEMQALFKQVFAQ